MKNLLLVALIFYSLSAFGQGLTAKDLSAVPMGFVISEAKVDGVVTYKKGQPSVTLLYMLNKRKAEKLGFTTTDSLATVKDAKEEYEFCESYVLFFQSDGNVGNGQNDTFFQNGTWVFDEKAQTVTWTDEGGMVNTFTVSKPAALILLNAGTKETGTLFTQYK
jgi:hypothetical protein